MRREEWVQLELHREIVRKLRRDAGPVVSVTADNLRAARATVRSPLALGWLDRWQELLDGPLDELVAMCLRDDELGIDMRQVSPFAGALTQAERLAAIGRASERAA